jgi:hypothetical protein
MISLNNSYVKQAVLETKAFAITGTCSAERYRPLFKTGKYKVK